MPYEGGWIYGTGPCELVESLVAVLARESWCSAACLFSSITAINCSAYALEIQRRFYLKKCTMKLSNSTCRFIICSESGCDDARNF